MKATKPIDKLIDKLIPVLESVAESLKPRDPVFPPQGFYPAPRPDEWLSNGVDWINVTHAERLLLRVKYNSTDSNCQLSFSGSMGIETYTLTGEMANRFFDWWTEKRKQ